MLEKLIELVKGNATSAITTNPAIPNEKNEEAIKESSDSIISSLKGALSGDNVKGVVSMFSKGSVDQNNPVVQQTSGDLITKLKAKFGLNTDQATGIANDVVPSTLNQLAQKTADPAEKGFDAQNIFNQLSDGKTSGLNIPALLAKFKGGLDKDADGDIDLQDLKAMFSGSGSITDKLKGLFS